MRRAGGQASVELVAIVPLLFAVALAAYAVLAAGRASTAAGAAAEAAAVAVLQGADAERAARHSLAGWPRSATTVQVRGGRVRIHVRPWFPLFAGLLTASAEADAGPPPAPDPLFALRGGDGASAARPTASTAAEASR